MHFEKYHAAGNDFILIDEWNEEKVKDKSRFAKNHCNRHKGIGGDGVIFLQQSNQSDAEFRLFQPDGSEAGLSGNGIRCFVKFGLDTGRLKGERLEIETNSGTRNISIDEDLISVNMGVPKFQLEEIPAKDELINKNVHGYRLTACNTGVPHAVIFTDNIDSIDLQEVAPSIRNADVFLEGANVNFAEKRGECFRIRTYERGVEGETLSCGTGSVAVAAAARKLGKIEDQTIIKTKGGELKIRFEGKEAFLQGSAQKVFSGEIN